MQVVILAPIPLEFNALKQHLSSPTSQRKEGMVFEVGLFTGVHHRHQVHLLQTGAKNTNMALAAIQAIRSIQPQIMLLVGIAGGVKDAVIGDVVVANKAYGYESSKETADGPVARPEVLPFSTVLLEAAGEVSRAGKWSMRCRQNHPINARVWFGPIASGDKVVATSASPLYQFIRQHYNDTLAIDMEAIGFAQAVLPHRQVHALTIRGISDLLDHKSDTDEAGSQEWAADHAAAFAYELLYRLPPLPDHPDQQNNRFDLIMSEKAVQYVLQLLAPEASDPAISKEFPEGARQWARDWFLQDDPHMVSVIASPAPAQEKHSAVAAKLERLRQKSLFDQQLQQQLEAYNLQVQAVKNTMLHSNIHAGGNVIIGDVHHHHAEAAINAPTQSHPAAQLQRLIGSGELGKAIAELAVYAEKNHSDLHQEILQLSGRWETLQRNIRMGVLSTDEATVERNRVSALMLQMIGQIPK